jgi:hypothetical protein
MPSVSRVVLGQSDETYAAFGFPARIWTRVRTRGRRRLLRWNGTETLAAYVASTSDIDDLVPILTANGFEPFEEDGVIRLRNCPFDSLVSEHRELTCGLNLAFLGSVASTLSGAHLAARRQSHPALCCVEFAPEG